MKMISLTYFKLLRNFQDVSTLKNKINRRNVLEIRVKKQLAASCKFRPIFPRFLFVDVGKMSDISMRVHFHVFHNLRETS